MGKQKKWKIIYFNSYKNILNNNKRSLSQARAMIVFFGTPFALVEIQSCTGNRRVTERVAAHERSGFVQSAGVCPSSLQLTETLMMVKGPPALACPRRTCRRC